MSEKKWDVFVYGDVNVDLVIPGISALPNAGAEVETEVMETFTGGGAALFSMGTGKLGLKTVFQGEVGDDLYRDYILKTMKDSHVDTSAVKVSKEKKTGISISFTNEKDRSFLTYRGTNANLSIENIDFDSLSMASHIHITGYEGEKNHESYLRLLKKLRKGFDLTVSFDLGWDMSGQWKKEIYDLFPYIDVLFMNETEALHYSRKESPEEALADFAKTCFLPVIKLGKRGAMAAKEGEVFYKKGFFVEAVDTTGAGDSFNAGFIYGFLSGFKTEECLLIGNACGALSVTALGGNTAFPDRKGLKKFLEEHGTEDEK